MGDYHPYVLWVLSMTDHQCQPFLLNLFTHLSLIPFFLQDYSLLDSDSIHIRLSHSFVKHIPFHSSSSVNYHSSFQYHSPPYTQILKPLNHISCFSASFIPLISLRSLPLLLLVGNSPLILLISSHVPVLYSLKSSILLILLISHFAVLAVLFISFPPSQLTLLLFCLSFILALELTTVWCGHH